MGFRLSDLVIFLALSFATINGQCPDSCSTCDCITDIETNLIILECRNWTDSVLPPCINNDVGQLLIYGSAIANLSANAFEEYNATQLTTLALTDSPLVTLEVGVFNNLTALKHIELVRNQLSYLPDDLFKDLGNLSTLDLKSNKLGQVTIDVFNGLLEVTTIDLSDNSIFSIDDNTFSRTPALLNLDLSYNGLGSLTALTLADAYSLKTLNLNNNILNELKDGAFNTQGALKELNLSSNQLLDIPLQIFDQQKFSLLDLSRNAFLSVPPALNSYTTVEKLILDENPITSLRYPDLAMSTLTEVSLNLMGDLTEISNDVFKFANGLTIISIQDNPKLVTIDKDALSQTMDALEELYLSNNMLTLLHEEWFSNKVSLQKAEVFGNPVECTCSATWMKTAMDQAAYPWIEAWKYDKTAVVCDSPPSVNGKRLSDVGISDLVCKPPMFGEMAKVVSENTLEISVEALGFNAPSTVWTVPQGKVIHPNASNAMKAEDKPEYSVEETQDGAKVQSKLIITPIQNTGKALFGFYICNATDKFGTSVISMVVEDIDITPTGLPPLAIAAIVVLGVTVGLLLVVGIVYKCRKTPGVESGRLIPESTLTYETLDSQKVV